VTEVRPAADPPPTDDARRAALMFAMLGFAALPRVPADMAPAFKALHQWLDGWKGIGAGVTKNYITMLEVGKRKNPSLPVLKRLAEALGVPVAELLG
jgi:Helix-turn-helix